jgi:SAM-dependent methyltransferase
MTEDSVLSEPDRERRDDRPDTEFYSDPRFVVHADDAFLARLTDLYADVVPGGGRVFDAMSSWVSHLPDENYEHVVGHGLNDAELAANDRLDDYFVQDLNADQALPLADDSIDAVLCALSVQYLQYPAAVFQEFRRVVAADGVLVVSFTDRMFPTKAVRAWRFASMADRETLVREYADSAGFSSVRVTRDQPASDPFRAVVARP